MVMSVTCFSRSLGFRPVSIRPVHMSFISPRPAKRKSTDAGLCQPNFVKSVPHSSTSNTFAANDAMDESARDAEAVGRTQALHDSGAESVKASTSRDKAAEVTTTSEYPGDAARDARQSPSSTLEHNADTRDKETGPQLSKVSAQSVCSGSQSLTVRCPRSHCNSCR